ncbi:Zn-ribbon domain-containing OB-fold protein [Pseudorhodoferax sp.]|uniref:Zn-ribbon domain-containing OB-fold protein n=1 Tax=Pseudorhodoferax sp. TaxID=1993553 RepID=UPI002DD6B7E9|nr:OB-fold domain-containing protein [Pseudorhodoferax sp.]
MNIAPQADATSQPFWDAVRAGQFALQHCAACAQAIHPPGLRCPACRSAELAWRPVETGATVYACTVVRHAALDAVKSALPYAIVLVTLDAGPRMVLNVIDRAPDDVRVGDRGQVVIHRNAHGIVLPQFQIQDPPPRSPST